MDGQNERELIRRLRAEAAKGDADAQLSLGACYLVGAGVPQDDSAAVRWYRRAANRGHVDGQFGLAFLYGAGRGLRHNQAAAARWYFKAAAQGNVEAQFRLGLCHEFGYGVQANYIRAARFYRRAVKQGHKEAHFSLGQCFEFGRGVRIRGRRIGGVRKDVAEAIKLYREAVEPENRPRKFNPAVRRVSVIDAQKAAAEEMIWWSWKGPNAECRLAACYSTGKGVAKDETEAAKWYRKAAERGGLGARFILGERYVSGLGVAQDFVEAFKWLNSAASGGVKGAKHALRRLVARMTPEQVAEGRRLGQEFYLRPRPHSSPLAAVTKPLSALSLDQLKQAVHLREQMAALEMELAGILGGEVSAPPAAAAAAPAT